MPFILLAYIINLAEIPLHHIGRSNNNRSINWRQSTIQSRLHNNSSLRHSRNEMLASPINNQVMTNNENKSLLSVPTYNVTVTQMDVVTTTDEVIDFTHPNNNLLKFS